MSEAQRGIDVPPAMADTGIDEVDALIIGGGPAGLSAALNLGRARLRVALVDADRPRNAATMLSHGFLTRDGVPPHELRRLAREELEAYPSVRALRRTKVTALRRSGDGADGAQGPFDGLSAQSAGSENGGAGDRDAPRFVAELHGRDAPTAIAARAVIVATGLRETLPSIPSIRGYY
ncbi:MAG: FAD-dependent oxidoreductase, partial [Pseudoclavibacter sp.]